VFDLLQVYGQVRNLLSRNHRVSTHKCFHLFIIIYFAVAHAIAMTRAVCTASAACTQLISLCNVARINYSVRIITWERVFLTAGYLIDRAVKLRRVTLTQ
jgi:hypothetical protein